MKFEAGKAAMTYVLEGKKAVPCHDIENWGKWFETAFRVVAQDQVADVRISTVFLGLDHNFTGLGPPLLFETMVFHGDDGEQVGRYPTWEAAEAGHQKVLKILRMPDPEDDGQGEETNETEEWF